MDRTAIKETAKKQISGKLGTLLIINLIVWAITVVLGAIPAVGSVLAFVAASIFEISLISIYLRLSDGIDPQTSDLFNIFNDTQLCGNAVIISFLTVLFTTLWSLLFIVPGIIKALSYAMVPYIYAENGYFLTPLQSIDESKRIMQGHKAELFVLQLSFIGWFILSSLTCGILLIYVAPYYSAAMTNFYNEIKDKPAPDSYTAGTLL
ncbi:MAG: DUF975 family protein [Firmicutes bacterium]|nr:DUF975 family protein [Bacillota bacterium]